MASLPALPPELLVKILTHALTTSLVSGPLLVHGQFAQLSIVCRTCAYRQIATVCRLWRAIAQEVLRKDVTFANGCGSAERDEQVVRVIEQHPKHAHIVRHVDASMRGAACAWGAPPVSMSGDTNEEGVSSGEAEGFISSRQVQVERWHAQCLARERNRFVRLLQHRERIEALDVDVGFFQDVRLRPSLLPSSLRTLTLRNCAASDTFAILAHLPSLRELTLRLALDWFVPTSFRPSTLPALERFELSTTAFGATSLSAILTLLSSSRQSLTTLSLRNKGACQGAFAAFLPVAAGLIQEFAAQLVDLTVKDIPRCGRRQAGTGPAQGWFPANPTHCPRLEQLHLTGVDLPSLDFFAKTLVVSPAAGRSTQATSGLRGLVIEDFDSLSFRPLLEALRAAPALQRLDSLAVAGARASLPDRVGEIVNWKEEQAEIEAWCASRRTRLTAGWKLVRVEVCGW